MAPATITSARFTGPREPSFRMIGTNVLDRDPGDVHETLKLANLNYEYVTVPLFARTPDGGVHRPKFNAIYREPFAADPQWREQGLVSPNYQYLQNEDLLRGIRILQKESGWRLDSLGSLDSGTHMYVALQGNDHTIFGDLIRPYIILHDAKAQRRALAIAVSPTRWVCCNQFTFGQLDLIRITHNQQVAQEYNFWVRLLGKLEAQRIEMYRQLELMGGVKISDAQARTIIERAYPTPRISERERNLLRVSEAPDLTSEAREEVREKLRETRDDQMKARELVAAKRLNVYTLYERFNAGDEQGAHSERGGMSPDTLAKLCNTPYAVLQAITEMVDWGGQAPATVAATSALFGEGSAVKQRAWLASVAMAVSN